MDRPAQRLPARPGRPSRSDPGGGADGGYGEIEAEVLFGFVASRRPRRVIQIGCGVSTAVMLMAAAKADYKPEIVCIEPYPSAYLREAESKGLIRLVVEPAQVVDFDVIADLGDDDLLFVDSTHAVKPGSEVNYLIHEVLPRLRPGAWVHFHDIYFPYDYARDTLVAIICSRRKAACSTPSSAATRDIASRQASAWSTTPRPTV